MIVYKKKKNPRLLLSFFYHGTQAIEVLQDFVLWETFKSRRYISLSHFAEKRIVALAIGAYLWFLFLAPYKPQELMEPNLT